MDFLRHFIRLESAGGIILVIAAACALTLVNSPLAHYYNLLLNTPVSIQVGALVVAKPLLLWINDGLMAIFFLLVGLEIKREILEGQLSDPSQILLPAVGALGGMVVPAALYVLINHGDPSSLNGWAIPTATDIAFALGILALLGSRVPASLKIFLMTLAILDDLAGIVIIALFYSSDLSAQALLLAGVCVVGLVIMNLCRVTSIAIYATVGSLLWLCVLKSGVHATLAGVVIALTIPLRTNHATKRSPLRQLEHDLHPVVSFGVLPIFAFANAGIPLGGIRMEDLLNPVPLGIAVGLFAGKQIGVFTFAWTAIKIGLAKLPEGMTWGRLYGVALLCGVGFTMSLFIGSLAFENMGETGSGVIMANRLGILIGSLMSAISGYFLLRHLLQEKTTS
ncbi:MAG: Na+/H+ antiporter NhaA [Magnetococcales bacterium]|nr:Na+/H+ antiporter NhaA [Magnetococcales bacterium]MBF0322766.1 Na+/H+ antiporter NhaA [Magnetococcales bacterium]